MSNELDLPPVEPAPVAQPSTQPPIFDNPKPDKPRQKLTLDFLTDKAGLHGATLASIFTVGYTQFTIMPEIISQTIFSIIGGLFGLLYVRSIVRKAWKLFWLLFATITFSDVSVLLALTGIQSKQVSESTTSIEDPIGKAYRDATATAQANLTEVLRQQGQPHGRRTMDDLAEQITTLTEVWKIAQAAERSYVPPRQEHRIDASRVYMGIWDALVSGKIENYVKLIYSLIFSLILLLTILETAKMTAQRQRKEARAGQAPAKGRGRGKGKGRGKAKTKTEVTISTASSEPSLPASQDSPPWSKN